MLENFENDSQLLNIELERVTNLYNMEVRDKKELEHAQKEHLQVMVSGPRNPKMLNPAHAHTHALAHSLTHTHMHTYTHTHLPDTLERLPVLPVGDLSCVVACARLAVVMLNQTNPNNPDPPKQP